MTLNYRRIIAIAIILAACFVGWLQPLTSQPDATVYALVRLSNEESLLPESKQARENSSKAHEMMKRNEKTLVKSRVVLTAALAKESVRVLPIVERQPNSIEWLEKVVQVDFPNDGDWLRVGLSGSNPDEMVKIVNAIVGAYVESKETDANRQSADRYHTVATVLISCEEKLREQMKELRNLSEIFKTTPPPNQQVLVHSILDCSRELRRVRLELAALNVKLAGKLPEKEEGKDSKQGSKRSLEEQMSILVDQEKLLVAEERELTKKLDAKRVGNFDLDLRQEEIDVQRQLVRRLSEEKARLEQEKFNKTSRITIQEATIPGAK